jgi:hypothetical protein
MRLADKYNISGSLFYESPLSVILEIIGTEEDISMIMEKCRKERYIDEIHILHKAITAKTSTDFIMLNQID